MPKNITCQSNRPTEVREGWLCCRYILRRAVGTTGSSNSAGSINIDNDSRLFRLRDDVEDPAECARRPTPPRGPHVLCMRLSGSRAPLTHVLPLSSAPFTGGKADCHADVEVKNVTKSLNFLLATRRT